MHEFYMSTFSASVCWIWDACTFPAPGKVGMQLLRQGLRLLEEEQVTGGVERCQEAPHDTDDGLKKGQAAPMRQVKLLGHPLPRPTFSLQVPGAALEAGHSMSRSCR